MSSTNRGSKRIPNDAYYTRSWCVRRLLEVVDLPGGIWVEPCVGMGSIMHAVNGVRNDVTWETNDIIQTPYAQHIGNALDYKINDNAKVIITNPPFNFAEDIVHHCIASSFAVSIFLQRLNWCAGPRAGLFRDQNPSVYVLPNRPSFTDDGKTDSIEYGWFVFDHKGNFKVLNDTPLEERRRK